MISAIVLAAGLSTRMRAFKQLLPYGDRTVIEQIVSVLMTCSVDEIVVVVGHRRAEIRSALAHYPVKVAFNPRYQEEMLTSIQCGWGETSAETAAVMHVLGDQPHLQLSVVRQLIAVDREQRSSIIVPSYNHRRGHPILLDAKYREEILALNETATMRDFMCAHADDIRHVAVETDSILRDMDTPADYQRELNAFLTRYQM